MKIKLNGWQRIGVVLNAIYLIIIIIIAWYEWPTQKQIESSWVYSALDAIRKPESPYAYKLRESRFKDISDRELIKRINLEYNANKVREIMPTIKDVVKDPEFLTLPHEEKRKIFSNLTPEYNKLPSIEQDKVIAHFSSSPQQTPTTAQPAHPKTLNLVTDPFLIAQLEGELVMPGVNFVQQCLEKLKEVNLCYQKEIESLGINRLKIVGFAFMAWIIPSGIVYLLGFSIGWICKGFKENKTFVN